MGKLFYEIPLHSEKFFFFLLKHYIKNTNVLSYKQNFVIISNN